MKQYCRYCANATLYDDELISCCVKQTVVDAKNVKMVNRCKAFQFNEIDVFDFDRKYLPRKVKSCMGEQEVINCEKIR